MKSRVLAAVLIVSTFASRGNSGEISFGSDSTNRIFLIYEGIIDRGDAGKLRTKFNTERFYFLHSKGLTLDSPGGDIEEALKIADLMEKAGLRVDVQAHAVCASACFLIYVAAPVRYAEGHVILHRPYFDMKGASGADSTTYERAYRAAFSNVRRYLAERLVPDYIVETMMSKGSSEAYTLNASELLKIGFFSPAVSEYQTQVCKLPSDHVASPDEVHSANECVGAYLMQSRMKFLFGNESGGAAQEFHSLEMYMTSIGKSDDAYDLPGDSRTS